MRKLMIAIALAAGLGACVSMIMPMERLENVPVSHRNGEAGVGAAIDRALNARGWVVTDRRAGETDATLIGSEFRADITVRYSASSYSVVYRDSQGLDYDGQQIHRHYNNWLNNLRISIERELIAAPPLAQADLEGSAQ